VIRPDHHAVLRGWRERLLAMAAQTLPHDQVFPQRLSEPERRAVLRDFRDEQGHRPPIIDDFLAWRLGLEAPGTQTTPPTAPDAALWRLLRSGRGDWPAGFRIAEADGPLIGQGAMGLEVWTETELGAMHAGMHLVARGVPGLTLPRLEAAACWFIDHVQPDNATNHAWGIPLFIAVAAGPSARSAEADLYAQTLLHNCRVQLGRPDRLSAHILADAALALEFLLAPRLTA
jgi:hypothetical protein